MSERTIQGSEALSGEALDFLGVFHEWDRKRRFAVAERVAIVIRTDFEGEAMTVHEDVDCFVFPILDVDDRAGKQVPGVLHTVELIGGLGHGGRSRC